jgi:hypothetical protein
MLEMMQAQMAEMQRTIEGLRSEVATAPAPRRRPPKKKASAPKMLTFEEKRELSERINDLPGGKLTRVLQIISARLPIDQQGSDEIEIDIDSLDTATLRQLQKYVKTCSSQATKRAAPSKKAKPNRPHDSLQSARQASADSSERIRQLEAQLMGDVGAGAGADSTDSDVSDSEGEVVVGGGAMGGGLSSFYG